MKRCTFLFSHGGESRVRVWDKRRPVFGAYADERRGPEVPYLPHGRSRFWREESCVLCCWDLLWVRRPPSGEDSIQVKRFRLNFVLQGAVCKKKKKKENTCTVFKCCFICWFFAFLFFCFFFMPHMNQHSWLTCFLCSSSVRDLKPENILLDDHGKLATDVFFVITNQIQQLVMLIGMTMVKQISWRKAMPHGTSHPKL